MNDQQQRKRKGQGGLSHDMLAGLSSFVCHSQLLAFQELQNLKMKAQEKTEDGGALEDGQGKLLSFASPLMLQFDSQFHIQPFLQPQLQTKRPLQNRSQR